MSYSLDCPNRTRLRRVIDWFLSPFGHNEEKRLRQQIAELSDQNARLRQQIDAGLRVERLLKEERNLVRTLINSFPDLIYIKDTEGFYKLVNRALVQYTGGVDFTDIIHKTDYDFFPLDIADNYRADDQLVMQTGKALADQEQYNQLKGADQCWFITTKAPLLDADGQVKGIVGISRDITAQKAAELKLQQANDALEARVKERTSELFQANLDLQTQILERQKAEQTLHYQAGLLEHVSNAIISTDMQFNIVSWNRAAEDIYGWKPDEVIGKHIRFAMQAQFPNTNPDAVREKLLRDGQWQGEIRHTCKNGDVIPIYADVAFIFDENGERIGCVTINHDLRELRAAQDAEHEQRLLADALRAMADAINRTLNLEYVLDRLLDHVALVIPYDSANIMLLDNDVASVVRGRGYEERGVSMLRIYQMRFPLSDFPIFTTMFKTEHPVLVSNTGSYADWRFSGEPIDWMRSYVGAPIYIEGRIIGFLNLDSTQYDGFSKVQANYLQAFANHAAIAIHNARLYEQSRRNAAELEQRVAERTAELERQGAQLVTILDSMTEGVVGVMFNEDRQITLRYINRAFAELTGYIAEEWDIDLPQMSRVTSSDSDAARLHQCYVQVMNGVGYWQGEVKLQRKDGTDFDAFVGINRVTDLEEKLIGIVTVIRNISQRKALDEQRSRFVANASHELRTPITNLFTRLHLLSKQPERLPEHLDTLENIAGRMRTLVEELLEISRFEHGTIPIQCQEIDLSNIVSEVVELQKPEADKKHIHLTYCPPRQPVSMFGDADRLLQVFTNLVVNAIHYTPQEGRVEVNCEIESYDLPGKSQITVRVIDSGTGIPQHMLPHIFEPFYRAHTDNQGSGLGLSIAKEIVELHDGTICAENRAGGGACFTVRLALLDA